MPFNKASRLCWSAYDWKGQARRHGDEANRDYESINKLSHVPALRTGLPIFGQALDGPDPGHANGRSTPLLRTDLHCRGSFRSRAERSPARTEERRVGKECTLRVGR